MNFSETIRGFNKDVIDPEIRDLIADVILEFEKDRDMLDSRIENLKLDNERLMEECKRLR